MTKNKKIVFCIVIAVLVCLAFSTTAFAAGDVAGAIEGTWNDASGQIKTVVNKVVFPAIDLILAVFFFAKLGMAYFDYRKSGQFEWTGPAILFACLIFTITAPTYIWTILGMQGREKKSGQIALIFLLMMFTTFTMPAIFFVTTGSYGITTSTAE